MFSALFRREYGLEHPRVLSRRIQQERTLSLELCEYKEIESAHKGACHCLSIDHVEERYLLSGGDDCIIGLYDLEEELRNFSAPRAPMQIIKPLMSKTRGHRYCISSIQWYPHDTGMFITGSYDESIKVWDTNTFQDISTFALHGKVYSIGMSPIATRHCLIAAGSADPLIRLCDLVSGGFTHTLSGHREAIWSVMWSPVDEYLLVSASVDRTIRLWDVRRAGWLTCLDQFNTPMNENINHKVTLAQERTGRFDLSKRTSSAKVPTAHNGSITGLCFTPDGRYLLSTGTDNRLRLWDILSGKNTLVNYAGTKNVHKKGMQFAVSNNGKVVYHPNGNDILCFDIFSGRQVGKLTGHYEKVNACVFHPRDEELYTASSDHEIFIWSPPLKRQDEGAEAIRAEGGGGGGRGPSAAAAEEDNWD